MQEIRILLWCDRPRVHNDEREPGETIPPIYTRDGKPKVWEMCKLCQETTPYAEMLEMAEDPTIGRDPGKSPRLAPGSAMPKDADIREPRTGNRYKDQGKTWKCHYCPDERDSPQGRTMHERLTHPEEFAKAQAEKAEEARQRAEALQRSSQRPQEAEAS